MGFGDRFFTPTTARAILSWRMAVGALLAVVLSVVGLPIALAIALGLGVFIGLVLAARPASRRRPAVDPFVLSEPWRRLMQDAQGSGRKIRQLVDGMDDGPLRDTLAEISDQLDRGLDEAWQIARNGDEIDELVRNLDRTGLRARLAAIEAGAPTPPDASTAAAIESLRKQLATADRLEQQSASASDELRRTQVQLDELVARVAEVRSGAADTAAYAERVDELVIRLEALHQAVQETRTA